MPFSLRFVTMLLALAIPVLVPELSARAWAQTTERSPRSALIKQQPQTTAEDSLQEAEQLLQSGNEHFQRSDFRTALRLWEEALVRFRSDEIRAAFPQDGRQGEANALGNLGTAYGELGDYERAIDFYQQTLDIKRELGHRLGEAQSLGNMGSAYGNLGDYERAIDFHQQSLDIDREIGHRLGEGISLHNLGVAFWDLGNLSEAAQYLEASAQVQESL
ncbi:MAG: tetratricopeptide repeat protein, partial [Cyanobacteria bacterium J06555_12]